MKASRLLTGGGNILSVLLQQLRGLIELAAISVVDKCDVGSSCGDARPDEMPRDIVASSPQRWLSAAANYDLSLTAIRRAVYVSIAEAAVVIVSWYSTSLDA